MLTWRMDAIVGLLDGHKQVLTMTTDPNGWPRLRIEAVENCDHPEKWLPVEAVAKYLDGEILTDADSVPVCAECYREPCQCDEQPPTLAHLIDGLTLEWGNQIAETQFGDYCIEWCETSSCDGYWQCRGPSMPIVTCGTVESGESLCLEHYKSRVRAIFEPQLKG